VLSCGSFLTTTQLDTDGSGALEVEEWVNWWVKRCRGNPSPEKQQEVVARNAFKAADTDNSGLLEIIELGNLCEDLGLPLTATELEEAMKLLDKGDNTTFVAVRKQAPCSRIVMMQTLHARSPCSGYTIAI
jgi:Ca2+-binding EF-hand superfamily protein